MTLHGTELIVYVERVAANGPLTTGVVTTHGDSWDFIVYDVSQREVSLTRVFDAGQAATHIRAMLLA